MKDLYSSFPVDYNLIRVTPVRELGIVQGQANQDGKEAFN